MGSTRDQLGDTETFRRLVSGTIGTTFEEDSAVALGRNAFAASGIEHVVLPNVSTINRNAFDSNRSIRILDIGCDIEYSTYSFANGSKLESVILRYPDVISGASSLRYRLGDTRLEIAEGAVYVPDNLVERYDQSVNRFNSEDHEARARQMTSRAYTIIRPISSYPQSDLSTIEGSWADIIADIDAGTYGDKYFVGDTKLLELSDGNSVYMELVATDADPLSSDPTSKASMTWLCHGICPYAMAADGSSETAWPETSLYAWLEDELLPKFPSILRRNVKRVRKHYRIGTKDWDVSYGTSDDVLWIPSVHEVYVSDDYAESPDVPYYANNGMQTWRRDPTLSMTRFWTRDKYGNNRYHVSKTGSYNATSVYSSSQSDVNLVVFGFCL